MRKAIVGLVAGALLAGRLLPGCGGDDSTGTGSMDSGSSTDSAVDTTVPFIEGGTPEDSAGDGTIRPDGGGDAPTDGAQDSPMSSDSPMTNDSPPVCAPITVDDAAGVFVVSGSSDTGSCGSRMNPCATIGYALMQASIMPGKTTVYVSPGTYPESIALIDGIGISGGWNVSGTLWTHDCNAAHVQIAPPTSDRVVSANMLSTMVTLEYLTVDNPMRAGTGQSVYGIFSLSSSLSLNGVAVTVAAGGGGSPGSPGTMGAPGGTSCPAGNGANGSPGAPGTGGAAGTYSSMGFTAGDGTPAGTGAPGADGTAGGTNCKSFNDCTGSDCTVGNCTFSPLQKCQTSANGCGGGGGSGGGAGTGGGASIGLFAWGGNVTIAGGSISTGSGGAGGAGGQDGTGGTGSSGSVTTSAGFSACPLNPTCPSNCNNQTMYVTGGAAGGTGGTGGTGGGGGGGAGGDSYAYYAGGGATVIVSGTALVPASSAATGGQGGSPNGQAGFPGAVGMHN